MRAGLIALLVGAAAALSGCNDLPNRGRYPPPATSMAEASREAIASAIADPNRPAADRERDAARRPAEILAFARVAPGQRIADLWPGGGYFTRLFSSAVGANGQVIAFWPTSTSAQFADPILAVTNDRARYGNVRLLRQPNPTFTPEGGPLDLVFTAQNYHDFHAFGPEPAAFNRAVFTALRPGGLYVVIDHTSADGAGLTVAESLHRIEPSVVRREIEAAGFVFDGETAILRNPADPRTASVFDPSIRGRTDQFVMRFRKPAA